MCNKTHRCLTHTETLNQTFWFCLKTLEKGLRLKKSEVLKYFTPKESSSRFFPESLREMDYQGKLFWS